MSTLNKYADFHKDVNVEVISGKGKQLLSAKLDPIIQNYKRNYINSVNKYQC